MLAPHELQNGTASSLNVHGRTGQHAAAHLDIRIEARQQLCAPQLLCTSHTLLQVLDFLQNTMSCWHSTGLRGHRTAQRKVKS